MSEETATPRATPPEWYRELATTSNGTLKATYGNLCTILRHEYRERIEFCEMRATPIFDGQPFGDVELGALREEVEKRHNLCFSADNVFNAVRQVSSERRFHPVRRYLEGLTWDGEPWIERVLPEVLGCEPKPLYSAYMRRWFIGCVARGMVPGCKLDTSLVLHGPQGYRKSSFFAVLGGRWFNDTAVDITTRQGLLQIASTWIYEWAELERVTSKKAISEVKGFLSSPIDKFVPPYGRTVIDLARTAVFVGTTNETGLLNDPTGSRRFWVLPCPRPIALPLVQAWRDSLWAEAVHLYRQGEQWWLTHEEEAGRAEDAANFEIEDVWQSEVSSWLQTFHARPRDPRTNPDDVLTTSKILCAALSLEQCRHDKTSQHRIGAIMRQLGYRSVRVRVEYGDERRSVRAWRRESEQPDEEE